MSDRDPWKPMTLGEFRKFTTELPDDCTLFVEEQPLHTAEWESRATHSLSGWVPGATTLNLTTKMKGPSNRRQGAISGHARRATTPKA